MKRTLIVGVAASVVLVTLAQRCSGQDACPRPRLISVEGAAEINVAPDEVVLSLAIESRGKVLATAKSENDARATKVLALARAAGVAEKDIQTSALQMGPDYSEENVPRFLGYTVSQSIAITLRDLSKYEALMTQLLEAGVNRVDGISFQVSQPRKYRDEARSKAIAAAKEKAVAMATELGQTVGKPWEISEEGSGGRSTVIMGLSANIVTRAGGGGGDTLQGPTVAPGQVTIRASVTVSFLLE